MGRGDPCEVVILSCQPRPSGNGLGRPCLKMRDLRRPPFFPPADARLASLAGCAPSAKNPSPMARVFGTERKRWERNAARNRCFLDFLLRFPKKSPGLRFPRFFRPRPLAHLASSATGGARFAPLARSSLYKAQLPAARFVKIAFSPQMWYCLCVSFRCRGALKCRSTNSSIL